MTQCARRASYLKFFARNGHTILPGAQLVPPRDDSLLFTNSGMVQFKDVGAASARRCVRLHYAALLRLPAADTAADVSAAA